MNRNASGCPSNIFYSPLSNPPTPAPRIGFATDSLTIVEPWKNYVRQNEKFSCYEKSDGFYASRWCNVFYRCFMGIKYEFLCAKQQNGDSLWWTQHGQQNAQSSAQCAWPCDIKRKCTSPGGVLIENSNPVSESNVDVNRILNSCQTLSAKSDESGMGDMFRLADSQNNCEGMADGSFQADLKYCNVFHVCFANKRKDFLCAKASNGQYDLWWNDATKSCDWPCKVKCNQKLFGVSATAADVTAIDKIYNGDSCLVK